MYLKFDDQNEVKYLIQNLFSLQDTIEAKNSDIQNLNQIIKDLNKK